MVSEPNIEQCTNEEIEPQRGVDTRQCVSKDDEPRGRVDSEIPHRLGRRTKHSL